MSDESLQRHTTLDDVLKDCNSEVENIEETEIIIRKSYKTARGKKL